MRATVRDLKKRNSKAVNKMKNITPLQPGEITFFVTTLKPLLERTFEVTEWTKFQYVTVDVKKWYRKRLLGGD